MGYFSNGTEHEMYVERFCSKCVHLKPDEGGCAVENIHLLYNYKQLNKLREDVKTILDALIPPSADGTYNEQCRMFHAANPDRCPDTKEMF